MPLRRNFAVCFILIDLAGILLAGSENTYNSCPAALVEKNRARIIHFFIRLVYRVT
jgi:hypothetical protein